MPRKPRKSDAVIVGKIQAQGDYSLLPGSVVTEYQLAAFLHVSRRRVIEDIIFPDDGNNCPCKAIGGRYQIAVDDYAKWVSDNAGTPSRPRAGRKQGPQEEAA